jgi:hypothetical protein
VKARIGSEVQVGVDAPIWQQDIAHLSNRALINLLRQKSYALARE